MPDNEVPIIPDAEVSVDQLLYEIGSLTITVKVLRGQLQALIAENTRIKSASDTSAPAPSAA